MQNIQELNRKFGSESIEIIAGRGGLSTIKINNRYATAEIMLHGAHVLSYCPHNSDDVLWLSKASWFGDGKPIRGGIPVCWPWFGAHPSDSSLPSHGFARLRSWELVAAADNAAGETVIKLQLRDDEESRKLWDYSFELTLEATIGARLQVALTTRNTGKQAFTISSALHNYFSVADISRVAVSGLEGCRYLDTLDNQLKEAVGVIRFNAETDNVYLDTAATAVINDEVRQRRIAVAKQGSRTTVVWNPWIAKAARMPDFGDDEYKTMLCVETTNAEDDCRTILPDASHCLQTVIELL